MGSPLVPTSVDMSGGTAAAWQQQQRCTRRCQQQQRWTHQAPLTGRLAAWQQQRGVGGMQGAPSFFLPAVFDQAAGEVRYSSHLPALSRGPCITGGGGVCRAIRLHQVTQVGATVEAWSSCLVVCMTCSWPPATEMVCLCRRGRVHVTPRVTAESSHSTGISNHHGAPQPNCWLFIQTWGIPNAACRP